MTARTTTGQASTEDAPVRPRPLTVAELQQAMRSLHGRRAAPTGGDIGGTAAQGRGDTPLRLSSARGDNVSTDVVVVAAHAGAGASVVSLAVSDAAAATGRTVHLIEDTTPVRSGLVAAAEAELGLDRTGCWRRGVRSVVTLDRRAQAAEPAGRPVLDGPGADLTVVDLGLCDDVTALPATCRAVVVVCRPTVPGVRQAEVVISELGDRRAVLAVVGSGSLAPVVRASLGPKVRALRDGGQFVDVPVDRGLQISGLTDRQLPWAVRSAGARLVELLDADTARQTPGGSAPAPRNSR